MEEIDRLPFFILLLEKINNVVCCVLSLLVKSYEHVASFLQITLMVALESTILGRGSEFLGPVSEDENEAVDESNSDEDEFDVDVLLFELHHVVDDACVDEEERPDV